MIKATFSVYLVFCLSLLGAYSAQAADSDDEAELKKCLGESDVDKSHECFSRFSKEKIRPIRSIISKNMETSYLTFFSGVKLHKGMGLEASKKENMLYEGQIFHNISWYDGKVAGSNLHLKGQSFEEMSWEKGEVTGPNVHYWLDVPIRIGVRQLDAESKPVRTPSFNPGLRIYFYKDGEIDHSEVSYPFNYTSFGIHHYSNGQEGASILPDGCVNTESGSFSTNYAEFAFHHAREGGAWARIAYRQHFYGTFETFQHDQYERRHLSVELQMPTSDEYNFLWLWPSRYQFRFTETFRHGYRFIVKNDISPAMNVEAKLSDRFNTTIEMITKPTAWKDLSLYFRYDYGYDYYNINFQNRINRIQIGLINKMI